MALLGARVIVLLLVCQQCASAVLCPSVSGELEIIEHIEEQEASDELEDPNLGSIVVHDGEPENSSEPPWDNLGPESAPYEGISLQHGTNANFSGWPAPTNITLVKLRTPGNRASFEMRWKISSPAHLQGLRVRLCTPKCVNTTVPRTQFKAELRVPFYTKFTTAVIAIYQPPNATRLIEVSSNFSEFKSGVGPPNAIKKVRGKLDDSKKSLRLWWDRPSRPNGPIGHYKLQVSDSLDSGKKRVLTPTTIEATLDVTGMSGYGFEIILQAVNIDANTSEELLSAEYKASLNHIRLIKPAAVVPIWSSEDTIRFQISPPNYRELLPFRLYYQINTSAHVQSNYVTQVAIIDRLDPYQNVTIEVSTCYQTELFKQYICGEALRARGTTKIAAPSRIRKVDLTRTPNNDTVLTWTLPDKPNGPINGFRVYIMEVADSKIETRDLGPSERSITLQKSELVAGKSYEFSVAAYNKDPDTQGEYVGEKTVATPAGSPAAQAHWVVPVVVFVVLFVLCAVGLGVFFYVRSGRPLPSFLSSSK